MEKQDLCEFSKAIIMLHCPTAKPDGAFPLHAAAAVGLA
jgi:hypothetical protein